VSALRRSIPADTREHSHTRTHARTHARTRAHTHTHTSHTHTTQRARRAHLLGACERAAYAFLHCVGPDREVLTPSSHAIALPSMSPWRVGGHCTLSTLWLRTARAGRACSAVAPHLRRSLLPRESHSARAGATSQGVPLFAADATAGRAAARARRDRLSGAPLPRHTSLRGESDLCLVLLCLMSSALTLTVRRGAVTLCD